MKKSIALLFSVLISLATFAKEDGPVAAVCKTDIEKFCAGKQHVAKEVRTCLETKKTELSKECLQVLESTGPGTGMGKGNKK